MTCIPRPGVRPADSRFSSGPTKKRPGWTLQALEGALLGRSHRSKPGKARLKEAIERVPLKRFAQPEEVVRAIRFLAFEAPFATGAVLPLDGGTTMV